MQDETVKPSLFFHPDAKTPTREQQLANLYAGTSESPFDVLIIGGGATGAGIAVDATTRYVMLSEPKYPTYSMFDCLSKNHFHA